MCDCVACKWSSLWSIMLIEYVDGVLTCLLVSFWMVYHDESYENITESSMHDKTITRMCGVLAYQWIKENTIVKVSVRLCGYSQYDALMYYANFKSWIFWCSCCKKVTYTYYLHIDFMPKLVLRFKGSKGTSFKGNLKLGSR